jgi:hypothetical protein
MWKIIKGVDLKYKYIHLMYILSKNYQFFILFSSKMEPGTMTRNQLLAELKNFDKYRDKTEHYIKKSIGGDKLATVEQLHNEYVKLSKKVSNKTKEYKEIPNVPEVLPEDVMLQTLLYSDIDTVVNTCTTNKNKMKLCNTQFWIEKFKRDNLPIYKQVNDFPNWVKQYKMIKEAKHNAEMMTNIIMLYNKYKGDATIFVWYENGSLIDEELRKDFKIKDYQLKQRVAFTCTFDRKNKKWQLGVDQEDYGMILTHDKVIAFLTTNIYRKMNKEQIWFADFDQNAIYYYDLIKSSKKNGPIPRAYLAMYELLQQM